VRMRRFTLRRPFAARTKAPMKLAGHATRIALAFALPILAPFAAVAAGSDALLQRAQSLFRPLPKDLATSEFPVPGARVELGRRLFFDPRISLDGTVSCARCHQPALYGTDGLAKPVGVKDRVNPRNAPTVLNAALQFVAHWHGDRANVEDQATKALVGPPSFGNPSLQAAMAKVKAIPGYAGLFRAAFPADADAVTAQNWGKAIGAYERTLVTPSPFDAYLSGDANALTQAQKAGLAKFIDTGCAACHGGVGVGGAMYQKFGVVQDYWKETRSAAIDKGRFDATGNPADLYVFKVPGLRNVAMTPPYFHDGSVERLEDAVRIMAKVQLGQDLSKEDADSIVAFLGSLTGALPETFRAVETLPPGTFAVAAH